MNEIFEEYENKKKELQKSILDYQEKILSEVVQLQTESLKYDSTLESITDEYNKVLDSESQDLQKLYLSYTTKVASFKGLSAKDYKTAKSELDNANTIEIQKINDTYKVQKDIINKTKEDTLILKSELLDSTNIKIKSLYDSLNSFIAKIETELDILYLDKMNNIELYNIKITDSLKDDNTLDKEKNGVKP